MQKLYAGQQQQYNFRLQEQIVPQGVAFFPQIGKKHFPNQQRGEIDTYQGMYHLYDPPKRFGPDYDRNLNTKDIDGAVTNTLKSKVVKNQELAQTLKQDKQKSLWEQSSKPISDIEYQPRKRWDDVDPSKNRSAIYPTLEDKRQPFDQKSQEHIEPQYTAALQGSHSQPELLQLPNENYQPQYSQPTQHSNQAPQIQAQFFADDDRTKQQQLLMQKQWDQQRLESLQRHQQFQNEKLKEYQQVKQQQDIDQQIIAEQRQQSLNQKQQYARDLRVQQDQNRENYRKGFTPPPVSKSDMINQLLQPPSMQKSQGFQGEPQQSIRDSLSQQIEENDKKIMINRFRPHELQQYIYDMKNGRIGGGKSRNNPTYMSYAGQQLVNQ